jgi:hypothetical protein
MMCRSPAAPLHPSHRDQTHQDPIKARRHKGDAGFVHGLGKPLVGDLGWGWGVGRFIVLKA